MGRGELIGLFIYRHPSNCFAHILRILQWELDRPLLIKPASSQSPSPGWEGWKSCGVKLITTFLHPGICLLQHCSCLKHLNILLIKSSHYPLHIFFTWSTSLSWEQTLLFPSPWKYISLCSLTQEPLMYTPAWTSGGRSHILAMKCRFSLV